MRYATPILLFVSMFLWICAACVFGAQEAIEPEPLVIDSCELQVITEPNFVKLESLYRIDLPEKVTITWGKYSAVWIDNFQEQGDEIAIMREIISNFITFDSMVVIDKTSTDNGVMVLDFTMFFRHPAGNWVQPGGYGIHFDWYGHRYYPWKKNEKSILLGTMSNDAHEEVIQIIETFPSWLKFSLRHTSLDSIELDQVYVALLANCKCCASLDIRELPIAQARIDQFIYQEIILIQ